LVVVCHDENVQRWWGKLPQRFLVFWQGQYPDGNRLRNSVDVDLGVIYENSSVILLTPFKTFTIAPAPVPIRIV